jgi:hypothetical protein
MENKTQFYGGERKKERKKNPSGGKIFCSHPDQPWGPPSLLCNGYRVSFPRVKQPGRGVDHPPTHPHLVPGLKKEYSYTSTPPLGLRGLFKGELYTFLYIKMSFVHLLLPSFLPLVGCCGSCCCYVICAVHTEAIENHLKIFLCLIEVS